MKFLTFSGGLMLLLTSFASQAQFGGHDGQFSYTYLEGGWSRVNFDPGSPFSSFSENGFNLRGSGQFSEHLYVVGSWDRWELGPADLDADLIKAGLGFRAALAPELDWFAEGTWTRIDIDEIGSQNGGRLDLGVRLAVGERVELRGFGGYNVDGPEGDAFVFGGDFLFHINHLLSASIGGESFDTDVNILRVNLRLRF